MKDPAGDVIVKIYDRKKLVFSTPLDGPLDVELLESLLEPVPLPFLESQVP